MKIFGVLWLSGTILVILLGGSAGGREWVATDGRKLEAEFVSTTDSEVKIKRVSDGREFTIALVDLSEADQKWVAENKDKPNRPRLGLDPEDDATKESPYAKLFTGDWELAEYRNLPYAIYAGEDLDSSKSYPLILGLHGRSEYDENGKQMGFLGKFTGLHQYEKSPAILVAPLCFQPYGATGEGWDDKPGRLAINLIKDIIRKTPMVDETRVYVLGHSMGGRGTVTLLTNETKLFAAGIVIAGWADPRAISMFRRVPVWAFHGSDDDVVEPDSIRKIADKLKRSKIFKYTEYPGKKHGITGKVLGDANVLEWLFAQKRE